MTGPEHRAAQVVLVDEEHSGQRIDNFVMNQMRAVPRSAVYRMLRRGEVRINGGRCKPSRRVSAGDRVRLPPRFEDPGHTVVPGSQVAQQLENAIIHENPAYLVLNKPSGLAVHGGSGVAFGVIEALRHARSDDRLDLVHRLDRDTSGCLVIAKRRRALTALHGLFREGTVRKRYLVVVRGRWPRSRRRVTLALSRYVTQSGERRVRVDSAGKPSRTDYDVVAGTADLTLLHAHLKTGRTHQIRVHCAASGNPVLGDVKYDHEATGGSRLALHAERIRIPAIAGASEVRLEAPVDNEMSELVQRIITWDGQGSS